MSTAISATQSTPFRMSGVPRAPSCSPWPAGLCLPVSDAEVLTGGGTPSSEGWSEREAGGDHVVPMGHFCSELTTQPAIPTPGLTSTPHRRDSPGRWGHSLGLYIRKMAAQTFLENGSTNLPVRPAEKTHSDEHRAPHGLGPQRRPEKCES